MEKICSVNLEPKLIIPEERGIGFSRILSGFPESMGMKSGIVSLLPGDFVGVHNTGNREELLIILKGRGEFLIVGREPVQIQRNQFFYCPPDTEHNVINTGTSILKYVYVVSPAKK
ncbi:MAG: cupin domain-containing protein [Spirochaetaceae bacterium]|nr:cupin domain-containing protein [Spirochaetaceae bacterium]